MRKIWAGVPPITSAVIAAANSAGATEIVELPCPSLPGLVAGYQVVADNPNYTYQRAINAGLTITSSGTPAIDAVYALDLAQQATVANITLYISVNGKFPGGLSAIRLRKAGGGIVSISSTAMFPAIASAIADYVAALDEAALVALDGGSPTWPNASVTLP